MNELKIFQNPTFGEVRVTEKNGEPMFCLADVCKAVKLTNPSSVKSRLDAEDIELFDLHALNGFSAIEMIGNTTATFITEAGFYDVLLFSSSPNVKPFRKWITKEVIPSIRKTGGYMVARTDDTPEEIMARALLIANDAIKRKDERIAALQRKSDEQQIKIDGDAPKVNFANALTSSDDCILVRELAKLIKQNGVSIGGGRLWAWLREHGYICKNSCEPTQYAMEKKLFVVVTRSIESGNSNPIVKRTTKVTQRGCLYFINKFISCCS